MAQAREEPRGSSAFLPPGRAACRLRRVWRPQRICARLQRRAPTRRRGRAGLGVVPRSRGRRRPCRSLRVRVGTGLWLLRRATRELFARLERALVPGFRCRVLEPGDAGLGEGGGDSPGRCSRDHRCDRPGGRGELVDGKRIPRLVVPGGRRGVAPDVGLRGGDRGGRVPRPLGVSRGLQPGAGRGDGCDPGRPAGTGRLGAAVPGCSVVRVAARGGFLAGGRGDRCPGRRRLDRDSPSCGFLGSRGAGNRDFLCRQRADDLVGANGVFRGFVECSPVPDGLPAVLGVVARLVRRAHPGRSGGARFSRGDDCSCRVVVDSGAVRGSPARTGTSTRDSCREPGRSRRCGRPDGLPGDSSLFRREKTTRCCRAACALPAPPRVRNVLRGASKAHGHVARSALSRAERRL